MARTRKQARRPASRPQRPVSSQRNAPASRNRPNASRGRVPARSGQGTLIGWVAVGLVIAVIAVFVIVKATGGGSPSSTNGVASGRDPAKATAAITTALATIPASVFDAVGIDGQDIPFTVTAKQPALKSGSIPRFVYLGAEFCPYCAMMRWPLVVALDRFGTFTNLKQTSSANDDSDVPTLSFFGASYSSPYLGFTPYEDEDRNSQVLETVPNQVSNLYATYDGVGTTPTKFDTAAGIPFLDVGNRLVSSGTPQVWVNNVLPYLAGGGPGALDIALGLHDPTSSTGKTINAALLIAQANYITAAICTVDGGKPASVCSTAGVKAAMAKIRAAKTVS